MAVCMILGWLATGALSVSILTLKQLDVRGVRRDAQEI